MMLTAPLMSKSSFLGSLVNKFRQVTKIEPKSKTKNTKLNSKNFTPMPLPKPKSNNISPPPAADVAPANAHTTATTTNNRLLTVANLSVSHVTTAKTLEEQVGLPPRPKKPLTPYFRFMQEMRPKLQVQHPAVKHTDLVRMLSKQWETAEASLKQRLQEQYKRDQLQYVELRAKYDAKVSDEQRAEIKHLKQEQADAKERRLMRKRIKALGRPKKPASGFLRFLIKERSATPQTAKQTYREWHQKVTEKWARLSDAEKDVYIRESRVEMEQYKKEITAWEEKMIRLGHIDVVRHGNLIDPPEVKSTKAKKQTTAT